MSWLRRRVSTTSITPPNQPLCGHPRSLPPVTGRGRRDWRHDLQQRQLEWVIAALAAGPAIWFLGSQLGFW